MSLATAVRPRRTLRGSGARVLLLPPVALLLTAAVVPLIAIVAKAVGAFGAGGVVSEPVGNAAFRHAIGVTLLLAVLTTAVALVVGVIYALAMSVARPAVAKVLFAVLLLTFWISLLVRTYGWLLTLQPNGALDYVARQAGISRGGLGLFQTLPGLIVPMMHILLPYMVLPVYAAIQGVDPAQLRASRSLGASSTLVFRSVVAPALRPGAVAGTVIVFILSLGFYVTPAFLGAPGDRVVAIVIGEVFGRQQNLPLASAMGLLLLVAVLILYFIADRLLRISEQWERF
ncbi:MAG TPA: ABC transporter permease [Thermoleophilaceae bacterium]|jgi:ABC-type spermidine/putrescine transport system permease subunit I|nr:ABC transporter permease [Thermoleophilaceae bacterium]